MQNQALVTTLKHWGKAQILEPLVGGYRNKAWRVELDGQPAVAKTTRRSEQALRWLKPVHDAAEESGIVVSRLRPSRAGNMKVNGLTVETFIEGACAEAKDLVDLRPRLAAFHQRTRRLPQRPNFASSIQLLDQHAGGDVDFTKMPAALVAACRDAWHIFVNGPQSVVHGDLNLSNILITPQGRPALIDWDEARYDASLFDYLALAQHAPDKFDGEAQQMAISQAQQRGLLAWEIAVCWHVEHDYAQDLARRERFLPSSPE